MKQTESVSGYRSIGRQVSLPAFIWNYTQCRSNCCSGKFYLFRPFESDQRI